jgi:hypothetical protein
MKTTISLLTLIAAVLTGCSVNELRSYGAQQCINLPNSSAQSRADCLNQNKKYYEEYDKVQKKEPLSLKGALKDDDAICYKNPRPGEKACATNETTGK